jgi:hypothetical protein
MTPKDTPPGAMEMSEARLAERLSLFKEMARGYSLSADGGDPLGRYVAEFIANADTIITALRECATIRAQVQAGRERLESAFVAGFGMSGEGYNGEYPFENSEPGEMRKQIKPNFEAWLKATEAHRAALAQPAKTEGAEG